MWCFVLGWLALVPLLGALPAIAAMRLAHQVRVEAAGDWNPARSFVLWGCVLAWCGLGATMLLVGLILLARAGV
jgi:hypothetical protein